MNARNVRFVAGEQLKAKSAKSLLFFILHTFSHLCRIFAPAIQHGRNKDSPPAQFPLRKARK